MRLRRCLPVLVLMLGISTVVAGAPEFSASALQDREPASAAVRTVAPASSGTDDIVPVPARVVKSSGFKRGVRVKAPVWAGLGAVITLAGVLAGRRERYRLRSCRLSLVERARLVPRRGPPLLSLA